MTLILLVAQVFLPPHSLALHRFLNGEVRHGRRQGGPMQVLLVRLNSHHVTGMNFLDGAALPLHAPDTCLHEQNLLERMGESVRPCAWLNNEI